MKNLTFLFCCLVMLGARLPAWAQSPSYSEAASAEQRLVEAIGVERLPTAINVADARNISTLLQQGTGNRGTLIQNNTGVLANAAFIEQAGMSNMMSYTQTGEGNSARVLQNGNFNQLNVDLTGNNNEMDLVQDGDNNKINSSVLSDNRKYLISQQGDNNVLNQLESTPLAPKGYSVEMRGNGIQLTIEQGKVSP